MPTEVIMPKVDMDMASGKVMAWHVEEGSHVRKGAPLFEIETEKAAMEVEAETDGYLHHLAALGAEVAIGQPVAWLYAEGEAVSARPEAKPEAALAKPNATIEARALRPEDALVSEEGTHLRATPSARRLARAARLPLQQITGTGPRSRIQARDVEALVREPVAALPAFSGGLEPGSEQLAVTRKPGEGVPLVMVHGFAADSLGWSPLENQLATRPTIRIDLPSHGKSPLLGPTDFAGLARTIRDALDDLQLDRFDLIGHSLGGALALAYADVRPRKVRNLTMLAPAGLGPEINGATLDGLCRATKPESLAPWLKTLVADETLITDGFARLAHSARSPEMRAIQSQMASTLFPDGVQAFDLRAALSRLAPPTRIIWGKQDLIIPWKHALHAPGSVALHLFQELGHALHLEAPELLGNLMAEPA